MERPKVQDMEGSVTCPMRDCGWDIYWELDERLTISPQEQFQMGRQAALVYLDMHQQKEHNSKGNEANIRGFAQNRDDGCRGSDEGDS